MNEFHLRKFIHIKELLLFLGVVIVPCGYVFTTVSIFGDTY